MNRDVALCAVVLHFRAGAMTAACLRSLAGAGIGRVVVVDNSGDAGRSWREARAAMESSPPALQIELHDAGRNLGFAAGANAGLARAVERFGIGPVLFFNNDARLPPGAGEALSAAVAGKGLALAAPRAREDSGDGSPLRYYQPCTALQFRRRTAGCVAFLSGSALVMSADAVAAGLRWDEGFFFYGEDVELSARLVARGGHLRVVEEVVCEHEGAASSRRYSGFYEYNRIRADRLLAHRLLPRGVRLASWPLRESLLLGRALVHAARSRSTLPLAAYAGATWSRELR